MSPETESSQALTPEGCAVKAEDCRQDARRESNARHRVTLEHMAANWDRIGMSLATT